MRIHSLRTLKPLMMALAAACVGAMAARSQGLARPGSDSAKTVSVQIPAGTILPARLDHGLSSRMARPGQRITGHIMQAVPLAGGDALPAGARVTGTIVAATPAGGKGAGSVTLRFDKVEFDHKSAEISVNLRALASFMEVEFAQIPETPAGFGTPYDWTTTKLIGGDEKYGVDGPVTDSGSQTVGKGTKGGVLVEVRAGSGSPCHADPEGQRRLQALWVFSSDACGVYGMPAVRIAHAGRVASVGEIALAAEEGEMKIHSGAGMLLRVR